jgi:hypothetical protein
LDYYLDPQSDLGFGQLKEVIDAEGVWTGFVYDQWGQRAVYYEGRIEVEPGVYDYVFEEWSLGVPVDPLGGWLGRCGIRLPADEFLGRKCARRGATTPVISPAFTRSTLFDVGDIFMSLTHTCQLCGVNPLDDLTPPVYPSAPQPGCPGTTVSRSTAAIPSPNTLPDHPPPRKMAMQAHRKDTASFYTRQASR